MNLPLKIPSLRVDTLFEDTDRDILLSDNSAIEHGEDGRSGTACSGAGWTNFQANA